MWVSGWVMRVTHSGVRDDKLHHVADRQALGEVLALSRQGRLITDLGWKGGHNQSATELNKSHLALENNSRMILTLNRKDSSVLTIDPSQKPALLSYCCYVRQAICFSFTTHHVLTQWKYTVKKTIVFSYLLKA